MGERLDLSDIIDPVAAACTAAGFVFFREYPDSPAVNDPGKSLAVMSLGTIEHQGVAKRLNSNTVVLHGMKLVFDLTLTGRACGGSDSQELDGMISEVLAAAVKLTDPVWSKIELGELTLEPRVRRLVRHLTLICTVCMKEEAA